MQEPIAIAAPLRSGTDTTAMARRIRRAWGASRPDRRKRRRYRLEFDRGHWWITEILTGAVWGVEDADGPGTYDGFEFVEIAGGDEIP